MKDNFNISQWIMKRYLQEAEMEDKELSYSPNLVFKIHDFLKQSLGDDFTTEFPNASHFFHQVDSFLKKGKLNENQENALTIGDLELGVNIEKGDSLPVPNADYSRRINNEQDLESWKKDKDPNIKVVITPKSAFRGKDITIPDFEKGKKEFSQGKQQWLDNNK